MQLLVQVNTVGFYQLSKICITPAVMAFDAFVSKKLPTRTEVAAVVLLCIGVTLATVSDKAVATNIVGLTVGVAAICFTAVYQASRSMLKALPRRQPTITKCKSS